MNGGTTNDHIATCRFTFKADGVDDRAQLKPEFVGRQRFDFTGLTPLRIFAVQFAQRG